MGRRDLGVQMRRSITILLFLILFISGCDFPTPTPPPMSNLVQADILPGPEDQIGCGVAVLREAIDQANENPSTEDVINLASNCTYLIRDYAYFDYSVLFPYRLFGLPPIRSPITINGFNTTIAISSLEDLPLGLDFGIFLVWGPELTLNNLTLRDSNNVGAIENHATLVLNNVHFIENQSYEMGGGDSEFW
jgi:hypothetical protein